MVLCLFLTGCGVQNQRSVTKDLEKKINSSHAYLIKGNLSVNNNDDIYNYDIIIQYKEKDLYKVTITNTANEYTQIILKNEEGVYVLTPALNKSFKFQSDWPNQNSQIYLLKSLLKDILEDQNLQFTKTDHGYLFQTKVHYPNNSKLSYQKISFDKKLNLKKVIVYDKKGIDQMNFTVTKLDWNPNLQKKEFSTESTVKKNQVESTKETNTLDDVIYPLLLPNGTKLVDEEKVQKENGERVIMNYDGEKSFLLVEETIDVFKDFTIIPTSGEPYPLMDTLGVMTDNSLSWTSGNLEFYIVSDVLSQDEMIEIAQSITGVPSIK